MISNSISRIAILAGRGRSGRSDAIARIDMQLGDVVSIVGPTGSGKTTLINDIELFADADTPTGRRILIDGERPPASYRDDPACNPIALITQHTNFLSDLPVEVFLRTHAGIRCRDTSQVEEKITATLAFGNQLTGEPINPACRMTELSGGQTRALLIADATVVCDTPIVLLDEVENAGINRTRTLELLREHKKIFIFVTHDPRIALLSDYRLVMEEGRIKDVIQTTEKERRLSKTVSRLDDWLAVLRDKLRHGQTLNEADDLESWT